jgi:hypothetical protein
MLIPYLLGLSVLFIGVFVVILSFMQSIADVWNMPEYGAFIVLNSSVSIICTGILLVGILSKKVYRNVLLTGISILLLFDVYILYKQLILDMDIKYLVSMFSLVFAIHTYLIFLIIKKANN